MIERHTVTLDKPCVRSGELMFVWDSSLRAVYVIASLASY